MLTIIKDIDLIKDVDKYDVILVGVNTYHQMSGGFQAKVRKTYPHTYNLNLTTKYADRNKLGKRITTNETNPAFSLCFIVYGYNFRPDLVKDYLDYEALEKCLKTANNQFQGLKVATTVMGGDKRDGNGSKERILEIMEKNSDKIELFVYDYEQLPCTYERIKVFKDNREMCTGNKELCKKIVAEQTAERAKLTTFEEVQGRKKRIKKEILELLKK